MSQVPVLLKHPILARFDELSLDRYKVTAMRDLLKNGATAQELADVAVRNTVLTRELADHMLVYWANSDGSSGWLGDILDECRRGFLEAAEAVLARDVPLSSWWILGFNTDFRVLVVPERDRIDVFMATPHVPDDIALAKRAPNPIDPGFLLSVEALRDQLNAMLT